MKKRILRSTCFISILCVLAAGATFANPTVRMTMIPNATSTIAIADASGTTAAQMLAMTINRTNELNRQTTIALSPECVACHHGVMYNLNGASATLTPTAVGNEVTTARDIQSGNFTGMNSPTSSSSNTLVATSKSEMVAVSGFDNASIKNANSTIVSNVFDATAITADVTKATSAMVNAPRASWLSNNMTSFATFGRNSSNSVGAKIASASGTTKR